MSALSRPARVNKMNLTNYYRSITAVFDSPVNFHGPVDFENTFYVGKFEYLLTINAASDPDSYLVNFEIVDFYGTEAEKIQWIEKWTKKKWNPGDDDYSLNVDDYFKDTLRSHGFGVTGTGSATEVLSNVITILNRFRKEYYVNYYQFSGYGKSRVKLYNTLMRYLERQGGKVRIESRGEEAAVYRVYFPDYVPD
jgi:hypothetical protein